MSEYWSVSGSEYCGWDKDGPISIVVVDVHDVDVLVGSSTFRMDHLRYLGPLRGWN